MTLRLRLTDVQGGDLGRDAMKVVGPLVGAVLLLLGSAGFYFLLLSQPARVAKRTLANMELYTRNVIESIPAGLITLDSAGRIVSLNRQAKELFGSPELAAEGLALAAFTDAAGCPLASLRVPLSAAPSSPAPPERGWRASHAPPEAQALRVLRGGEEVDQEAQRVLDSPRLANARHRGHGQPLGTAAARAVNGLGASQVRIRPDPGPN